MEEASGKAFASELAEITNHGTSLSFNEKTFCLNHGGKKPIF